MTGNDRVEPEELQYPVIVFMRSCAPDVISTARRLSLCPEVSVRKGLIKGMEIVDSAGRAYVVTNAQKAGYPLPFFGFSLMYKRKVVVRLTIQRGSREMSCKEVQTRIITRLQKGVSLNLQREDRNELQSLFEGCSSVEEVITAYSCFLGKR